MSCDQQFLLGISCSSTDTAGKSKGRHTLKADPACIRDSQVSYSLWSCSAHSSEVAKEALDLTLNMAMIMSGKLAEPLQAAEKSKRKIGDVLGVPSNAFRA